MRTIKERRKYRSAAQAAIDPSFVELIYATLTSWGMHRLGRAGAKLPDFEPFCESIAAQADRLQLLDGLRLLDVSDSDVDEVAMTVWHAIDGMKASATGSQLVAGSKTIHHLIPELVPPIDREYTGTFFGVRYRFQYNERDAFAAIWGGMCAIAKDTASTLERLVDDDWNSSTTKVLDNAIVGYVTSQMRVAPPT